MNLTPQEQAVIQQMRLSKAGEYLAAKMLEIGQEALKGLDEFAENRLEVYKGAARKKASHTKSVIGLFTTPRVKKILSDDMVVHKVWAEEVIQEDTYSLSISPSTFKDFKDQADSLEFWDSITVEDFGLDPKEWRWEDNRYDYYGEVRFAGYLKKAISQTFEVEKASIKIKYQEFTENSWNDKPAQIEEQWYYPKLGHGRNSPEFVYDKVEASFLFADYTKRGAIAIAKRIIEKNENAIMNERRYKIEKVLLVLVEKKTRELLGNVPKSFEAHDNSWNNMECTVRFEDGSWMKFKLEVSYQQYNDEDFENCPLELVVFKDAQELIGQERFDYYVNKIVNQNS